LKILKSYDDKTLLSKLPERAGFTKGRVKRT